MLHPLHYISGDDKRLWFADYSEHHRQEACWMLLQEFLKQYPYGLGF